MSISEAIQHLGHRSYNVKCFRQVQKHVLRQRLPKGQDMQIGIQVQQIYRNLTFRGSYNTWGNKQNCVSTGQNQAYLRKQLCKQQIKKSKQTNQTTLKPHQQNKATPTPQNTALPFWGRFSLLFLTPKSGVLVSRPGYRSFCHTAPDL